MKFNRIHPGIACFALFAILLGLSPISIQAQSTTQGAIGGTVMDQSQAAIPNATVSIQNSANGFSVQLVTDTSGYFKAPLLEPGTYTVSVNAANFAKYRAEKVAVLVGQTTTLNPILAVASSSSEVIVSDQTPVMNLESPDFAGTLDQVAMQNIPINNRRWSSLAMTTPGVVSDSNGYGLVSVRGISVLLNNVEIDGADDNQAFFAEERGRTREAYSTSGNAVREFAVNTGVYSAQYGRAAGGVITSVTKSGTNQIHGQAYFYDKQSNWAAFNNWTLITKKINGVYTPNQHIKPADLRKIYGFTAGGPLIKDKLFWIYSYDQHTHVFPVVGIPYNPANFYTLPLNAAGLANVGATCNLTPATPQAAGNGYVSGDPSTDTSSTQNKEACTLAARQGISYQQAAYNWAALINGSTNVDISNYPGALPITDLGLDSAIGQVSRYGYQEINTPKLDWQINSKMRASALFHRLRWDSPGGVQTSASDNYSKDAQGNDFVKLDYGVAKLTYLISPTISNEVLYQYGRELDYENQQPYTPYTLANINNKSGNIPYVQMGASSSGWGFNMGSPYYSYRVAYPYETKWQVADILYWNKGAHSLKVGFDIVHNYDLQNNLYEGNGWFSYQYIGPFLNDLLNFKNGRTPQSSTTATNYGCDSSFSISASSATSKPVGPYSCYQNFYQGFGVSAYDISTLDTGVFVQDNWKFSPRLTLEMGLRWDHERYPSPNTAFTSATGSFVPFNGINNHPSDNTDFGPRIGFSYDISGKGSTVLRGGYGLYFGRITNGNILQVLFNTGSPAAQYTVTFKNAPGASPVGPQYPNIMSSGSSSAKPNSYYFSPSLKLPEVQEYDLVLQQAFGKSTYFTLSYLGALGRHLPNFLNMNLNPTQTTTTIMISDASGKGPLGASGKTYTLPIYSSYGNTSLLGASAANFQSISQFVSNVNSNYNGMVAEIQNHSMKSVQFDANYTWSHALDFMQNANTQGSTGNWYDPYGNYRVNYGNSNYNVPNRFVAYVLYNFPNMRASSLWSYLVNGWSVNDSFQMQNGLPYSGTMSGTLSGAASSGWNGSGGTSIIPMVGFNTFRYPRRIVDDVRVQKSISFERSRTIRSVDLVLNAFNVANHQNVTALGTTLYTLSGSTLTYLGQGTSYSSNNSFQQVTNTNSASFLFTPRQIEIAGRINF